MEVWKAIEYTNNIYEISNEGNLRRFGSSENIKGYITKYGYVYCNLRFNGIRKWVFRHVLVASAFIEKPNYKCEVNHINGIKTDNRVENLEWCTRSENVKHAYDTGLKKPRYKEKHQGAKIVLDKETGVFYECIKEASEHLKINYSTLVSMLNGGNKNNTNLIVV